MSNQHYFDVPFAFSGDVTAIPDPLQTGGTVSFTEGWNYNYQRDLATDPAALPIDRSTMNWLLLQITTALQQLQGGTVPEFILASQNGGTAYPYGPQAEVLWSASGNAPFTKYVNISGGTNSNVPSASDPTGATTGWQIACDPLSTSAQAAAGTNNASIMTPLLVAQQTALRALLAGSSSQVFNVGAATALTHASQAGQVQLGSLNYGGVAGGTANALTATLPIAPSAYAAPLEVIVQVASNNTGATTINVNGLGVKSVVGGAHVALQGGELVAGGLACFIYDASLSGFILAWATGGAEQVGNATQSQQALTLGQATGRLLNVQVFGANGTYTPTPGTTSIIVEGVGGGGGGGGCPATSSGQQATAQGGIAGTWGRARFTTGFTGGLAVTIGTAGAGGATGTNPGGNGGNTSLGSIATFQGGVGGAGGTASATASGVAVNTGNSNVPTITGGLLLAYVSGRSGFGSVIIGTTTATIIGGTGGDSPEGRGGIASSGTPGNSATGYGGGGAGCSQIAGSAGSAGGNGASGILRIYEYA